MAGKIPILILAVLLTVFASVAAAGYREGVSRYHRKDYAGCIRELGAYTERTPDPRAYYLMGYASYKLRDAKAAREYFRKAFAVDPNFRPAAAGFRQ